MKNLYTKGEFLTLRNESEMINENFIGKMFKGLWGSVVKLSKSIKGSKEINTVYDKYKKEADTAFAKFGNIGTAEATNSAIKANTPTTPTAPASGGTTAVVDNININIKSEYSINEADAVPDPETEKQNTGQQKTLANLTPEKLAEISKLTKTRIEEIKKQFETEINGIVARLSKNPDYSSDKLAKYSTVMKNQFNSYIYDQWYGVYQKGGDQKKLAEITKSKKEAETAFKNALEAANSAISEKQIEIKPESEYLYRNSKGKNITVKVIGKALGKNEADQDTTVPEHKTMWKVESAPKEGETEGARFWLAPSTLQQKPTTPPTV